MSTGCIAGRSLLIVIAVLILSACATVRPVGDRSYEQALSFGNESRRGVVLFLHGCDGLGGPQLFDWQAAWVKYLNERGFKVVAPDSFADPRPGESCEAPFRNKGKIYRIRAKQAAVSLERLRAAYPTSKILIWGHSEGAGVANLISVPVDGVITTGYQCGYRSSGSVFIRPEVPLLAIIGSADPYVIDALRLVGVSSADEMCGRNLSSPEWRAVIIPDMSHAATLERPQVREALGQFLDEVAP